MLLLYFSEFTEVGDETARHARIIDNASSSSSSSKTATSISTSSDTSRSKSQRDSTSLLSTLPWANLSLAAILLQRQCLRHRPPQDQDTQTTSTHLVALFLTAFSHPFQSRPLDRVPFLHPLPYRPAPNRRSEEITVAGGSRVDAAFTPTPKEPSLNV